MTVIVCDSLLAIIDECTFLNIPPSSLPNEKRRPGWSDVVRPFQDDAKFYHSLWLSYGKPVNCNLYNVMKRSRNQYHYAVRRMKRNEEYINNF